MGRCDEMRVASAINDLRREMNHQLIADVHDGRFQTFDNALNGLAKQCNAMHVTE